jgi:hypothetical protein
LALVKVYVVTNRALVDYFERETFTVEAVEWIRGNQPPGKLFSSYNRGGYLLWNLPEYPAFVDGRTDPCNDQVLEEHLQIAVSGECHSSGVARGVTARMRSVY